MNRWRLRRAAEIAGLFLRRLPLVVLVVLLFVVAAELYLDWLATYVYRSEIVTGIRAISGEEEGDDESFVGARFEAASRELQARVASESWRYLLLCNLRLELKELHELRNRGLAASGAAGVDPRVALHQQLLALPGEVVVNPEPVLQSVPGSSVLQAPINWIARGAEAPLTLRSIAERLEPQVLARVLVPGLREGRRPDERVVVSLEPRSNIYVVALQRKLTPEDEAVSYADLRQKAVDELERMLQREQAEQGAGGFGRVAAEELMREIAATPYLLDLGLLDACASPPDRALAELRQNLRFLEKGSSQVGLEYTQSLYPLATPFRKDRNIIVENILETALDMLRAEYGTSGAEAFRQHTDMERLRVALARAQTEADDLTARLREFAPLREVPDALMGGGKSEKIPAEDPLAQLHQLNAAAEEWRGLHRQIAELLNESESLAPRKAAVDERIRVFDAEPKTRAIRVESQPGPDLLMLRETLALKQAERLTLLKTCTDVHPFVKRLDREIEGLQQTLVAVDPVCTVSTEQVTGLEELQALRQERDRLADQYTASQALIERLGERLAEVQAKARDLSASLLAQRDRLVAQREEALSRLAEAERETLRIEQARREAGERIRLSFSDAQPSRRELLAPDQRWSYALSLLLGLLAGLSLAYLRRPPEPVLRTAGDVRRELNVPVLAVFQDLGGTQKPSGR